MRRHNIKGCEMSEFEVTPSVAKNAIAQLTLARAHLRDATHHLFNVMVIASHVEEQFHDKCDAARHGLEEVHDLIRGAVEFYSCFENEAQVSKCHQ
jgi:hypothetical protein